MQTALQQKTKKEDQVAKIIDKVLHQIFGEEATSLIYRHLERNYSLKRNELTEKIDVFAQGLEDFLRSGAYVIERKILDDIYSSYGLLRRIELGKANEEGDFVNRVKSIVKRA